MIPRLLLFFFLSFIMVSCENQTKDQHVNMVSSGNDTTRETKEGRPSVCFFSDPDTAAAGITLRDAGSALAFLGKGMEVAGGNTQEFYSSDKKQILGLIVHPGDMANQVSIFQIGYANGMNQAVKKTSDSIFETGHGIRLGLDKGDIIRQLGNCYTVRDSTSENMELYYSLELPADNKTNLLSRTHMPQYFASYKLKNDKLEFIQFGFEAP